VLLVNVYYSPIYLSAILDVMLGPLVLVLLIFATTGLGIPFDEECVLLNTLLSSSLINQGSPTLPPSIVPKHEDNRCV
jgi:hypothetical protein